MKRLVLAMLLIVTPAIAAPDVPGALDALAKAQAKIEEQGQQISVLRTVTGQMLGEARDKDASIETLTRQHKRDQEAKGRIPAYATIALGMAIAAAGVWSMMASVGKLGVRFIGIGIAVAAMGCTMLIYFQQVAIGGAAVAVAAVVFVIVDAVRTAKNKENAGIEIADGVQQAINAGAASFNALKPYLDQSQGPEARAIVNKATK